MAIPKFDDFESKFDLPSSRRVIVRDVDEVVVEGPTHATVRFSLLVRLVRWRRMSFSQQLACEIEFTVAERDTGEPRDLVFTHLYPPMSNEAFLAEYPRLLRHAMAELCKHEIDESIKVDGERIFDPHRGG